MIRPYKEFKEKWIGKRIDYDKCYGYQCVDLIKQYADEVLGLGKIGAIGNANKVQDSSTFKSFSKLGVKNLIQGDIIIRTRGTYGHIAIVDHIRDGKVYVLEQNGSGKNSGSGLGDNAIRVKDYSINWFDTILRNKMIIENYNNEIKIVNEKIKEYNEKIKEYNEKIKEYNEKIKVTKEYGESLKK